MDDDLFLFGVLVQRLRQVIFKSRVRLLYLAYMYICRRTDHVDFQISFTSIAKPSK